MYNKVVLVGRLTADPELKYTNNGIPVVRYCLAVDRNYKTSQGEKQTDFLNVVSWRKLAEISAKYLKKGKLVLVEGSIQTRKYQDKEGANRTAFEIQADNMRMLDGRGEKKDPADAEDKYEDRSPDVEPEPDYEDVPF